MSPLLEHAMFCTIRDAICTFGGAQTKAWRRWNWKQQEMLCKAQIRNQTWAMRLPRKKETRLHSLQQQKIEEKIERKRQQNMRKRRRERQETQETQPAAASVLQHKKKSRSEPHLHEGKEETTCPSRRRWKILQLDSMMINPLTCDSMINPPTRLHDDKAPTRLKDDKSTYTTPWW